MIRQLNERRTPAPAPRRRGVSSVLSMMFLVIFGSLAAAMAVVAQGNLRTADSALKVSRAMSAAETGLAFAQRRLTSEAKRFVTTRGVIDAEYAADLWLGTASSTEVTVLPPDGYIESTTPSGILEALYAVHSVDADTQGITPQSGDGSLPTMDSSTGTLLAPPIPLESASSSPYFRLKYELLADLPYVRVTSQGIDGDVTRTLQMDFALAKRIEYAILSPNRIMIGKNVRVEGPLGSRYGIVAGELSNANGDPLVMRSDFYYLDSTLSATLDTFFSRLAGYDVDGDGRLRPDHPTEATGLAGFPGLVDADGNEYVDDFDLFLARFDANASGSVDSTEALSFDDEQLFRLMDEALPDRDGDGDVDASDTALGYADGVISVSDVYAKVRGRLAFKVARAAWEAAHGASYQTVVHGPVVADDPDQAPTSFDVPDEELLEITTAMLDSTQTWFYTQAQAGGDFGDESSGQVLSGINGGGTYTAPDDTTWESVPYGAYGAYDYYQRPVYENMTFTNVRIPKGTNALFRDCTFVGVTYIETEVDCDHENWNYAGSLEPTGSPPTYVPRFAGLETETGGSTVTDSRVESNNIRFEDCTFVGSVSGDKPQEYTHWRNKVQFTGTTRFFIDESDDDLSGQADEATIRSYLTGMTDTEIEELQKSSILLPGWSVDVGNFTNEIAVNPADTPKVKLKGTIIAGILDARGTVEVNGTLLMTFRPTAAEGPLFYGGQLDAFNTTIGYFGPADGDGEGIDPTHPDFNGFGEIVLRYDPEAKLPDGIPWPLSVDTVPETYYEGGSM